MIIVPNFSPGRMGIRIVCLLAVTCSTPVAAQTPPPDGSILPPPVKLTAQEDHQRIMDLLHITSLRRGADGNNLNAPNAANSDEAKANPYPNLPDPLIFKNGKKVTNTKAWTERRKEILEDFDREIYGRVPQQTPKVKWEVTAATREMNGDVPVLRKDLVGHVDNTAYPLIVVDIQLTLTTPANAPGAVPVIRQEPEPAIRRYAHRSRSPGRMSIPSGRLCEVNNRMK